jgi:hypothetical protein
MRLLLLLFIPFSLSAQSGKTGAAIAMRFINSLDSVQMKKTLFDFEQKARYDWHYIPASMAPRQGLAIKDLNDIQRKNFYDLLKNYLSDKGYQRTKDIMSYEYLLKELEPDNPIRVPENYFVAIYGNPAADSVWGWKFSGHHVALNFTIIDNQLAFAPFFFGVYPAEVKEGPQKGRRLIKDEEDLGFELVNSLTPEEKKEAIFQLKAFTDIVTTNSPKVTALPPEGIFASSLTDQQKLLLNKLIVAYLSSMPGEIAHTRMKRIASEDMNEIRFGWAGGLVSGEPHYYRIQGKTFLIEFDNTQANANHIQTVWRDFNGDFGEDLLKEHYQTSKHHLHN